MISSTLMKGEKVTYDIREDCSLVFQGSKGYIVALGRVKKTMTFGGRIPAALQAIFTASNNGEEVHRPPGDGSADKVYRRGLGPVKSFFGLGGGLSQSFTASCAPKSFSKVPPQAKFHLKLKERGYFPRNFASTRSGYYNQPTDHQRASYGSAIIDVVKRNKVQEFRNMLEAGLSPNACNQHGESLLHMVCRHGKLDLFNILVAFDVDVQQTDDYGRTPMHDCCWASQPSFEIARCLIERDPQMMFLFDARGSLPLTYVTKTLWGEWNHFMEDVMDIAFPWDNPRKDMTPLLCNMKPNSRPVPDPKDVIPASLASMVATGTMQPYECIIAMGAFEDDTVQCSEYDSEDSSDGSDSDFDSDEEEELFEIVGGMQNLKNLKTIQEF